jgi:hypothetical protein
MKRCGKGVALQAIPDEHRPVVTLVYMAPVYLDSKEYQIALGLWEWSTN